MANFDKTEPYAVPPYGQNPSDASTHRLSGQEYYPPHHHPHGNSVAPAPYPYPYYPPPPQQQQQQQQQQQVVVVNNQAPTAVFVPTVSMSCAITLSCLVFWFCGWLFGGIAFILALVGQSAAAEGDTLGAIRLRNASYGLSITGIVIGIIIIIVVPAVIVTAAASAVTRNCYYNYNGVYTCN